MQSSSHQQLHAQPAAPALEGDNTTESTGIQNDQHRGMRLERLDVSADAGPDSPLSSFVRAARSRFGPRLRPSRAPPIA